MGHLSRRALIGSTIAAGLVAPSIISADTITIHDFIPDPWRNYSQFKPKALFPNLFERQQTGTLKTNLRILFDRSGSIDPLEYNKQKIGTANALRSDFVKSAILYSRGDNGQNGIGFSLDEFDSGFHPRIPEAILQTEQDIEDMASLIEIMPEAPMRSGTAVFNALNSTITSARNSRFVAYNQVVDISGDGLDNVHTKNNFEIAAFSVRNASRACTKNGIRCNGLAIQSNDYDAPDFAPTITDYYRDFVKTEDGFVLTIQDWDDFQDAMEIKLMNEIALQMPKTSRFQIT